MRHTKPYLLIILALLSFAVFGQAAAAVEAGTITVSGVVLPAKYVYVDTNMNITKIISNTPNNAPIIPLSASTPTQKVPLTPKISREYSQIAKRVNVLKYGQVYPQPKPPVQKKKRLSMSLAQIFRPFTMRLWSPRHYGY
jgi:hypothetical protein